MKRFLLNSVLISAVVLAPVAALRAADTNAEVTAHQGALDLAGAFTNDGFKLRDGNFKGTLKPGQTALIQVNLYAGNEYWFTAATAEPKAAVTIALYDEAGKLMKTEPLTTTATATSGTAAAQLDDPFANANRVAAGFSPDASGPYYVRVSATGAAAATYCLIYSYK